MDYGLPIYGELIIMNRFLALILCAAMLVACKDRPGQDAYSASEVGMSRSVEFGTVLNAREVDIQGEDSKYAALIGAGLGGAGGATVGKGSGKDWAIIGTAVAGAIAGHYAGEALNDRKGMEYVVQLQSGETKTIVQEENEKDVVFKPGDHVMLQYCDGGDKSRKCSDSQYQRLLPVKKLPPYAKKMHRSQKADVEPAEIN